MSTHRSTARLCGLIGILLGQKSTRDQECIGRSRGGLSTKIHATCDALGNPTSFHLTPGQAHDLDGADALLPELLKKAQALLADKADGARERVLELLEQAQVQAVIPQKSNKREFQTYFIKILFSEGLRIIKGKICSKKRFLIRLANQKVF